MKKTLVLVVLFIFPLVAYLFFASGVNNFGKLPVLTPQVDNVVHLDKSVTLQNKITILGFLGSNVEKRKGNAFNLNQKIYKRFHEFNDFQLVMVVPIGQEEDVKKLKTELGQLSPVDKWNFVFASPDEIQSLFDSLKTNTSLDAQLGTPQVFIIDKDRNLRGRDDDEDLGTKYGFNTTSVADLNNKMEDDMKIILAEYRLALKKNNADRSK
ncbi:MULTISPECIES: hypothetical protein [Croceitalea]|uniref:Alkyl hydroperoxide reductase subunit C/ Thiol specific antioxidant domain-containing protein n=1 Tax=Croceitalea vernalis TaxID=3075599 RepID=A0ABU3BFT0_9FLAO|nr:MULTISPECIES: hypothetical protein [unclassified Croceitalea]MDT0539226.1 hypothetical protein [Croceitalea sp. P059]MDT0621020.1 hypothetical protein [Croceitalea sp. P007]